jgi:glycosyltransferase involved in cell wall biosynthesis
MKILVVTPRMPFPAPGADEQDRLEGIRLFIELGHTVSVITKTAQYQTEEERNEFSKYINARVRSVPYRGRTLSLKRLVDPRFIDGAAFEYEDPTLQKVFNEEIKSFRPDVVWLDASFSWPLIKRAHAQKVRVIVRSLQIESQHILDDEGQSLGNYVRYWAKSMGERVAAREADALVAINKNEEVKYRDMGARKTITIPLRNLPSILELPPVTYKDVRPLRVLFSGSTFSVQHNRDGALHVLTEIAPELERRAPREFMIYVTGKKLPSEIQKKLPSNVVYEGYVKDYSAFLGTMDIAITSHLGTVGMHGKLFEPVCRGIPTITAPYALAGFPFVGGEHLLFGTSTGEVVDRLLELRDLNFRSRIGSAGRKWATELFSREQVLSQLKEVLQT